MEYVFLKGVRMADEPNTHLAERNQRIALVRMLNILAAFVWCLGGVILLIKGVKLLAGSASLFPSPVWLWVVAIAGLLLGAVKASSYFPGAAKII